MTMFASPSLVSGTSLKLALTLTSHAPCLPTLPLLYWTGLFCAALTCFGSPQFMVNVTLCGYCLYKVGLGNILIFIVYRLFTLIYPFWGIVGGQGNLKGGNTRSSVDAT